MKLLGYTAGELRGINKMSDFFGSQDKKIIDVLKNSKAGEMFKVNVNIFHKNKTKKPYILNALSFKDKNKTFIMGIATDVSELIKKEEEIEKHRNKLEELVKYRTQKLNEEIEQRRITELKLRKAVDQANEAIRIKGEFLSKMSHEFRTPLNSVLGFSKILMQRADIPEAHKNQIEIIYESGHHLLSVINDVLNTGMIEANKIMLNTANVQLHRVISTIYKISHSKAESKGVQLIFECSHTVPSLVIADELKLKQIMLNLVDNAIKYTNEGFVYIKTDYDTEKSLFMFEVEDTGIGISASKQQSIFKPFVKENKPDQDTEGSGLGLAIVKELLALMDGKIRLKSKEGEGSIFDVELTLQTVENTNGNNRTNSVITEKQQNEISDLVQHEFDNELINELCAFASIGDFNAINEIINKKCCKKDYFGLYCKRIKKYTKEYDANGLISYLRNQQKNDKGKNISS